MRLAVHWFTNAANRWNPQAQFQLAMCYAKGVGLPKDIVKAYMWATVASRNGYQNATSLCGLLENQKLINNGEIAAAKQLADLFTRTNSVTASQYQFHDVVENIHLYENQTRTNSVP